MRAKRLKSCWVLGLVWLASLAMVAAEPPELLEVPDVRQSTSYTCGASALQAVLAYWGHEYREDKLVEMLGTNAEVGTPPAAILRVAGELGLSARLQEHTTLEQLALLLSQRIPVIVAGQAWRETEEGDWSKEWLCGHYMVVIGLDDKKVYFEDPSLLGSRGFISRQEFLRRWHDMDGAGRRYEQLAIIIEGQKPSPPPALAPVE